MVDNRYVWNQGRITLLTNAYHEGKSDVEIAELLSTTGRAFTVSAIVGRRGKLGLVMQGDQLKGFRESMLFRGGLYPREATAPAAATNETVAPPPRVVRRYPVRNFSMLGGRVV